MFQKLNSFAVKVAIFILLAFVFWLGLTKIIDKDSIGSLTDWISSLSSFFTLLVAFKAYKSAPNWLKQKLDESALSQATEIISKDLYHYRKLIDIPYNEIAIYVTLRDLVDENQDFDPYLSDFIKGYKGIANTLNEISELGMKIESGFSALHKMGWVLKEDAYDKYKKLDASTSKLFSNYNSLIRLITIHENLTIDNHKNNAQGIREKNHNVSELSYEKFQQFSDDFQFFFHYSNHIPDYFEDKN